MRVRRHKFSPSHACFLDSQDRYALLEPEQILERAGIRRGMRVADVGAGSGFFTIPIAKMVGNEGKVFAIDIQEGMIAILNEKLKRLKIKNVEALLSTEERIPLPDESVDLAFLAQTLHELEDYATLEEIGRILKPRGTLAILEWKKDADTNMGPPFEERLTQEQTIEIAEGAGFALKNLFENLSYHYLAIFVKQSSSV